MRPIQIKLPLLIICGWTMVNIICCRKSSMGYAGTQPAAGLARDTAYHSTIKDCPCTHSRPDGTKIEMTINGKKLCFNRKKQPEIYLTDRMQTMGTRTDIYIENWLNSDSTMGISIAYQFPGFLRHGLPYSFQPSTADSCEIFAVHLYNFHPYQACQYFQVTADCRNDDGSFFTYTARNHYLVTVHSFQANILEASFEGDFSNYGGRLFDVRDGYLRIQLQVDGTSH